METRSALRSPIGLVFPEKRIYSKPVLCYIMHEFSDNL